METGYLSSMPGTELKFEASGGTVSFGIRLDEAFCKADWFVPEIGTDAGNDLNVLLEWKSEPDGPMRVGMTQKIIPGLRAGLPFPISEARFRLEGHFLVPFSALRKGGLRGQPTDKAALHYVRLVFTSKTLKSVTLYGWRFAKERPEPVLEGSPRVDRFGQSAVGDWENRIKNEAELEASLRAAYAEAEKGGSYPDGWSKWGGWTGKRFDATGYFHLAHDGRRHWLVDPDGYAFFSNGVCYGERVGIFSFTEEYRKLHEWLPDENGAFADAWCTAANIPQYVVRNGTEGADRRKMFNFARANLIRVFGDQWHEAYTRITAARLKRMGFNTVGVGTNDYYDERTKEFLAGAKIPYVVTFRTFPLTEKRIFRDFPDVFGEEYRSLCRAFAERELAPYRGDPYLIGYFVTNEPEWFFGDVNLTDRLLAADGCEASRRKLIEWLTGKYADVAALNEAWGTAFDTFGALMKPQSGLYGKNERLDADFQAFEKILAEAYGQIVSDELHRVDADHLNLGMRYAGMKDRILGFNMDYFDIFSVNCYKESPEEPAGHVASKSDKPVVIGEWHIGSEESGLPAWGLRHTKTQTERAAACRYYAERAVSQPNLVGIHYFEYNDQPYFGRFDGECYNIGLADVCHRPYRAVCGMFTDFAKTMYMMLDGQLPPTAAPIPTETN